MVSNGFSFSQVPDFAFGQNGPIRARDSNFVRMRPFLAKPKNGKLESGFFFQKKKLWCRTLTGEAMVSNGFSFSQVFLFSKEKAVVQDVNG